MTLGRKIESDHPTKPMASHFFSVRPSQNLANALSRQPFSAKDYRIYWGFPLVAAEVIGLDQVAYKATRSLVGNGKKPD